MTGIEAAGEGLDAHLIARRGEFDLDVELSIPAGTTTALLGPNGAGKSTSVDVIAGLLPLSAGHLALGGRVLDDPATGTFVPSERRRVGVVFQRYLLFEHLSALDNVAFGLRATGHRRRDARLEARRWLEQMGIADLADRRPARLSGGQAQRVALARTLATEPELLLLDEPLAALDVGTRNHLRHHLADHLSRHPGPRLLITHDPTDAFLLADRVAVIEHGRLTQVGTPAEIRRRPATAYVAALAGTNLLRGTNTGGRLTLTEGSFELRSADTHTSGPVLVTIRPNAVALHAEQPHGSPRNTWPTRVGTVEPLGETTRLTLDEPLRLTVDVTPGAVTELGLEPGAPVWASVKATEVELHPDD